MKPGLDMGEGVEGADHESGANEEHKGKADLDDDQDIPGAMPLASLADGAAALAQAGAHALRWRSAGRGWSRKAGCSPEQRAE